MSLEHGAQSSYYFHSFEMTLNHPGHHDNGMLGVGSVVVVMDTDENRVVT